jgi:hypothetical protein
MNHGCNVFPKSNLGIKLYFRSCICPQYYHLALPTLFWKYTLLISWCLCVYHPHYELYQMADLKESTYEHHVTRNHLYLCTFYFHTINNRLQSCRSQGPRGPKRIMSLPVHSYPTRGTIADHMSAFSVSGAPKSR